MEILEYVLIGVLILSALAIVAVVLFQKSNDEGLSGAISGNSDTFYGRDKGAHTEKKLFKWTIIAGLVFTVAVLAVYIIQPDYAHGFSLSDWTNQYINNYSHVFPDFSTK